MSKSPKGEFSEKQKDLAVGVRLPYSDTLNDPVNFLYTSKNLSGSELIIKKEMKLSEKLYRNEDVVGVGIDRIIEFGITPIHVEETEHKELNDILNYWIESLNEDINICETGLLDFAKTHLLSILLFGNFFPYENWKMIKKESIGLGKGEVTLPTKIIGLNPKRVSIDEQMIEFGIERISFLIDDVGLDMIMKDGRSFPEVVPFKKILKKSQIKKIKRQRGGEIDLNPNLIQHLKRRALHFNIWGIPYLTRAFEPISELHKIRELDRSVIDGLIRSLVIFKLGDKDNLASPGRINSFANLISNPKPTEWIVWPHDIDFDIVQPKSDILQYREKYLECYDRVFIAMGIPPILMGRETKSDAETQILSFSETLRDYQNSIVNYIEYILRKICIANGYPNVRPKARMDKVNIHKMKEWTSLRDAYLTGAISVQQYVEGIGYNYRETVEARRREKEEGIEELMSPHDAPFQGNNNSGGRPSDSNNPQNENEKNTQEKKRDKYEDASNKISAMLDEIYNSKSQEDVKMKMHEFYNYVDDFCDEIGIPESDAIRKLKVFDLYGMDLDTIKKIFSSIFRSI